MAKYIGHSKASQAAMKKQAATPQNVGAKIAQTDFFAYICMFLTLFNDTIYRECNLEPRKHSPYQLIEYMKYTEFERIISQKRLRRYVQACGGNTRKAMTLYRYNSELAQSVFAIVGLFEVALRNAIDRELTKSFGDQWLKDSCLPNGIFDIPNTHKTCTIISNAYSRLSRDGLYSHTKLLAEMEFGIWKYMFSPVQYRQTGRTLLHIFPNRPRSSAQAQYNSSYVFNELDKINTLRNRIAHHEPICFHTQGCDIYTDYILNEYRKIITLLEWMGIDSMGLLYGLDHVTKVCNKIDRLRPHIKQNPPA
ncbi:MAG: Abi family protein [Bacteroidaceae bacterium]|nr:Abi family protein [Bacteroidaceae bacterium]